MLLSVKALDVTIIVRDTSESDDIMAVVNALPLQVSVTAWLQLALHVTCHSEKHAQQCCSGRSLTACVSWLSIAVPCIAVPAL